MTTVGPGELKKRTKDGNVVLHQHLEHSPYINQIEQPAQPVPHLARPFNFSIVAL